MWPASPGVVQFAAPGAGHIGSAERGHERVGAGGDQQRGEGQGIARHVVEAPRAGWQLVALVIGRGDQQGAAHLALRKAGCGMDERRDAERMGDQHHRAFRDLHGLDDRGGPVADVRVVPFVLLDHLAGREAIGPAALPVGRLGIAEAGNDQDVSVGDLHVRSVLG